jgi:hypothetical protein
MEIRGGQPSFEIAASAKHKVLSTNGNLPKRTPTREVHVASKTPYLYGFITKLCRQQTAVILNHKNVFATLAEAKVNT